MSSNNYKTSKYGIFLPDIFKSSQKVVPLLEYRLIIIEKKSKKSEKTLFNLAIRVSGAPVLLTRDTPEARKWPRRRDL